MTLLDVIPSLRVSLPPSLPAQLWPATTARGAHGEIVVGGTGLAGAAEEFGTPLYVLDEEDVRTRCRQYATAFGAAEVAYAAKALTCRAVLRWVAQEGLSLSVCSAGQLAAAAAVDFPADRIILHGDAKTPTDLRHALAYGVGTIVIESPTEVARLAALATGRQRVLLRVLPGRGPDSAAALPAGPTTVAGRHDEAGDVIVRDAPLPGDLRPGDLLAVPGSGAYHLPLASNYNLVPRPPLVAVHNGQPRLLVRRETIDDMLTRDVAL